MYPAVASSGQSGLPDRPFHNFKDSKPVDLRILCSSDMSVDFGSPKLERGPSGGHEWTQKGWTDNKQTNKHTDRQTDRRQQRQQQPLMKKKEAKSMDSFGVSERSLNHIHPCLSVCPSGWLAVSPSTISVYHAVFLSFSPSLFPTMEKERDGAKGKKKQPVDGDGGKKRKGFLG